MNRRNFLVPVWFLAAALAVGSAFRFPLVTDDPFITYRYAQNLAAGNGFVYNPGEHILSTTAPLYALVLAAGSLFNLDIPWLGYWVSVLSCGVAAYLLYRLAQAENLRAGGLVAGAVLLAAPGLVMTFGLETGFYLMWSLASVYAHARGRVTLAFVFAGLLTLTRNDGVLLAVVLGAHYVWSEKKALAASWTALARNIRGEVGTLGWARPFLVYLGVLAPWLLYAWAQFGSPFPFTLAAKIAQADSGLWEPFGVGLLHWTRDSAVWLAPLLVLALAGCVWAVRARSLLLLIPAWAGLHLAAYTILGVAFYPWYVAPVIPALALFAGIGAERLVEWIAQVVQTRGAGQARVEALRFVALGAIALAIVTIELYTDVSLGMTRRSPKVEAYKRAAEWIADNTPPDATVDALEVGVIGYYDRRRTVDFVGLVDPPTIPYLRAKRFADGVRRAAADYVIAIPPDTWLPKDVWFKDAYRQAVIIHASGFYDGKPLVIYERAGAGESETEEVPLNAAFEKQILLESVGLYSRAVERGQTLPVRLALKTLTPAAVPETWKFTLQLVGAANRVVAQTDNYYPVRLPADGDSFMDYQGIPIAKEAARGQYTLILAMYDVGANERLSFYDANGNEAGDFLDLGKVEIK